MNPLPPPEKKSIRQVTRAFLTRIFLLAKEDSEDCLPEKYCKKDIVLNINIIHRHCALLDKREGNAQIMVTTVEMIVIK